MASVIQLVETDAQIPGAGSVSIRGADEARNTFALKKTSRAARILSPQSIWDENSLLQILRDDGIKDMHAWNIWKYLIRTPNIDISQVRLEVCNSLALCGSVLMRQCQTASHAYFVQDIPGIPRRIPDLLRGKFVPLTSRLVKSGTSQDGQTSKLLIELQVSLPCKRPGAHC